MAARVPVVLGILTIVGVVAWFALRDGSTPAPTTASRSANLAPRGAIAAPEGPAVPAELPADGAAHLGAVLPPATTDATEDGFAAEPPDKRWAATTELEIARRWKKVRGARLAETECRHTQCRITIVGNEAELGTTIADLEGPRGMKGYAQNVLLTAPTKRPDGSIELRAYLKFER